MDGEMNKDKELLFGVITGENDYKVYTNGEIEGFEKVAKIINRYPMLLAREISRVKERNKHETRRHETA